MKLKFETEKPNIKYFKFRAFVMITGVLCSIVSANGLNLRL